MENVHIRNIIYDFGGIFFEIDYHAPVRAFKALGFQDFDKIYAQAAQTDLFDKLETGKLSNEDFYLEIEKLCPVGTTREQIVEAWNCILLYIDPDKVALAQTSRDRGIRTFLLSNTNAIHVAAFEKMIDDKMGIDVFKKAFEKIYYSNEIGIKKPYPSTFLEVCKWNELNPKETLFIDDSIQHVEGAKKAGLHAAHLKPGYGLKEILEEFIP